MGAALCTVASQAGFRVHVIDEREDFASPETHPCAAAHSTGDPLELLEELPWGPDTFAVIVTHSHRQDEDLLARCIDHPHRYLGMIGSRAKVLRFLKRYNQKGIDSSRFDDVRAPIGLEIGAREPGEIAVAIAAEIVAVRRGRDAEVSSFGLMRITGPSRGTTASSEAP